MADIIHSELLKDKEVLKEIDRFKWIESEKAGHDIGFEKASRQWLDRYAASWITLHLNNGIGLSNKSKKSFKDL